MALAAPDEPRPAAVEERHRRTRDVVVVRGHRDRVRAGPRDGDRLARPRRGERDVANQEVAALAVPPGDRDGLLRGVRRPIREDRGVPSAVERRTDVVAHAAVDRDERADAGNALRADDPVERDAGPAHERASRLQVQDGGRGERIGPDRSAHRLRVCVEVERPVLRAQRDPEPAAECDLAHRHAGGRAHLPREGHQAPRELAVAAGLVELGAEVRVDAGEAEPAGRHDRECLGERVAGRDRCTELRVERRGPQPHVRVDVDAGREPEPHRLRHPPARHERPQALDLLRAVDDDATHVRAERARELLARFRVPVQLDARGREARAPGGEDLTERGCACVGARRREQARDAHEAAGLHRVRDAHRPGAAERRAVRAVRAPHGRGVVDVERRSPALGERDEVGRADGEAPVPVDPRRKRPQRGYETHRRRIRPLRSARREASR